MLLQSCLIILFTSLVPVSLSDPCQSYTRCKYCIREPKCMWCAEPIQKNDLGSSKDKSVKLRCRSTTVSTKGWCNESYIINPESSAIYLKNAPLGKNEFGNSSTQITPQHVQLKLRVGQSYSISFQYGIVEDYPMDLYYLMDLSKSMESHKATVSALGNNLADAMKNVTRNFRLGFGSFVDKIELPFVNTEPEKLKVPCKGCYPPYSFKNQLPLTTDTTQFSMAVGAAQISGNIDSPEGGLDAIMQTMVCTEEIGWRSKARHLLVYSSDDLFHIAGDGKLAGVVEPNDCKCHLQDGSYTHYLVYDYPSIAQISEMAKKNTIIIIFAVHHSKLKAYQNLAKRIEGATAVPLRGNSSNVIDIIKAQYNTLVESVTITDNAAREKYVEIRYSTNCLNTSEPLTLDRKRCGGLLFKENLNKVTFHANITLKSCPSDRSEWKKQLEIYPTGLNEKLLLDIEMLCDCPCSEAKPITNECQNGGTTECGVCVCDKDYFGQYCECKHVGAEGKSDQSSCINETTKVVCSNSGICICGVCECNARENPSEFYYGALCECDNFTCKRHNGKVCSGEDHGVCDCGRCVCNHGWAGDACECAEDINGCIDNDGVLCSNRGSCVCGSCVCNSSSYSGDFCEDCVACPGGLCKSYKDCVECKAYGKSALSVEDCFKCNIEPILVDYIPDNLAFFGDNAVITGRCKFPDYNNECTFTFNYTTRAGVLVNVYALKEKECGKLNLFRIIGGVIGSIVLIGLITLLMWKVLTTIHDQQEFKKFENERANAKFSREENPLYTAPSRTFNNPTFGVK